MAAVAELLRAPAGLQSGWCAAWDGTELVCDLRPGHAPALPREHRGHVQINGRGPFRVVYFDADHHREPVMEQPDEPPPPVGTCTTCGNPVIPHPYRHPITTLGGSTTAQAPADTPATAWGCTNHQPTQHRDQRPKWCNLCGRTADGSAPAAPPAASLTELPRHLPPAGTRVSTGAASTNTGQVVGHDDGVPNHLLVRWDTDYPGQEPHSIHVGRVRVLPAVADHG